MLQVSVYQTRVTAKHFVNHLFRSDECHLLMNRRVCLGPIVLLRWLNLGSMHNKGCESSPTMDGHTLKAEGQHFKLMIVVSLQIQ